MDKKTEFVKELKKQAHDYEKWENSVEGIMYNLFTWGDATWQDEKNKIIIAKTLQRLPKKIRRKVLNEVTFMIMTAEGTVAKLRFTKSVNKKDFQKIGETYNVATEVVVIFLNFPKRQKEEDKMVTVAHEIAHFILGDYLGSIVKRPKNYNGEKAADDLIEKWGFERAYKSYNF